MRSQIEHAIGAVYSPSADDLGCMLTVEAVPFESQSALVKGITSSIADAYDAERHGGYCWRHSHPRRRCVDHACHRAPNIAFHGTLRRLETKPLTRHPMACASGLTARAPSRRSDSSDSDDFSDAGSVACSIAPTKAVGSQGGGAKAPSCVWGKPMMARPPFEVSHTPRNP